MGKKKDKTTVKVEKKDKTTVKVQEETQQPAEDEKPVITEDKIKTEPEEEVSQRNRKARLIVRNLSFKATEINIRKFFKPYGEITDIQILKKPDGRLVGCCFVEYAQKTSAAKALANASGKPLLHRPIVVDWAVPKDKFIQKSNKTGTEDSEESGFHEDDDDKSKVLDSIKKEDSDDEDNGESDDDDDNEDDNGSEIDDDSDQQSEEDGSNESEGGGVEDDSDMEEDSEDDSDEESNRNNMEPRKPRRESRDISEGCTVFVKNIPFSVDNDEFKKCMKRFGAIYYALICIDPLTEHSKGTGFVKFRTKDFAESCLAAGRAGEITLHGSIVETVPALSRDDLQNGSKKKNEHKDGRNLYLIKEGVILAGSPAATGVSATDMGKRLQLEQWKTQMLKNLNKYVSRNRLVIQNLPPSYDDQKLRGLFLKYGGNKPVITEARVMRNLRNVDATGKGQSKEFAFVTFTSHENALHALRALNNNPTVFTPAQRPIVAFSIEDRKVLNIRQKRLEKSRVGLQRGDTKRLSQKEWEEKRREVKQQGPMKKQESEETKSLASAGTPQPTENSTPNVKDEKKVSRKERRKLRKQKFLEKREKQIQADRPSVEKTTGPTYMGEQGKEGQTSMMSRRKLREQAQIFKQTRKEQNREGRKRKRLAATQTKLKQPKQAKSKVKAKLKEATEDNFSHLVDKYRSQLNSSTTERKKWYDD